MYHRGLFNRQPFYPDWIPVSFSLLSPLPIVLFFLQVPFSEKDAESSRIKEEKEVGRQGLPRWLTGKEPTCQSRRRGSSLGQEDPLEKEMATHSSILAWGIPWTEKPGELQFMGSQKNDLGTKQQTTGHVL